MTSWYILSLLAEVKLLLKCNYSKSYFFITVVCCMQLINQRIENSIIWLTFRAFSALCADSYEANGACEIPW